MSKDIVIVNNVYKSYPKYKRFGPGTCLGQAHWILATIFRMRKEGVVEALKGVSFRVKRKEIFAIVGPNGAGKTTLVKCIGALLLPDKGYIEVDGVNVVEEPLKAKKRMNLVGSGYWGGFDWSLSLEENLQLFALLYGYDFKEAKRRAKEVLDIVGLSHKAKDNPTKLSSGERQRLALAKGFIADVPLYLIDEPTVGLDPVFAKQIRDYIKTEMKKRGITVIFTTHFMHEAEYLADRIAIIKDGKIIALGTADELKAKFTRGKVVEIKAYNVYEDALNKIKSIEDIIHIDVFHRSYGAETLLRILTRNPLETLNNVLDILLMYSSTILYANISEPTLEDVYRAIVGEEYG
ncbi:MAG: ABC transporter ATP-binding protein [Thermoprotei archaeon]|nr:MAG: ABC transporter ATP-binding protein [Thermoprotei archaeon]